MRGTADETWMDAAEQKPEKLYILFNLHPVENKEKSLEEGRPIFDELEFIKIMVPGDKLNIIHRPVRASDKQRFAAQYSQWKGGQSEQCSGTPLAEWPGITRAQVEELAYYHVHTVEQLAELSDSNAQSVGPVQALKAKAVDYILRAKGEAPADKIRAELAKRDNEIEVLRRQLKEQSEAIADLRKSKKG